MSLKERDITLAGHAGFGSFMQDESVEQLILRDIETYTAPVLSVSPTISVPAEFGQAQRSSFLLGMRPNSFRYLLCHCFAASFASCH